MRRPLLLHPFIFSVHPIIFLYVYNLKNANLPFLSLIYCLIFFLALSIILYVIFQQIIKHRLKAGIFLTLFISFLYFPLLHLENIHILTLSVIAIISVFMVLITLLLFLFILKTRKNLTNVTIILNNISVCLVIITLISGVIGYYQQNKYNIANYAQKYPIDLENNEIDKKQLPNIIYIIFDSYAGEKILNEIYSYDNRKFLNYLKNKGFFIARNGSSNYYNTINSLASSLNLDYLPLQLVNLIDKRPLIRMIRENRVRQFLARYGYTFVAFSSGSYFTEIDDADIYIDPVKYDLYFENMVFSNTLLKPLFGRLTADYQIKNHRERIFKIFDKIPVLAQGKSPFFLFAHFICPHPPFVFGKTIMYSKNGDIINESDLWREYEPSQKKYIQAYNEQVDFLNQKIIEMLNDIFTQSVNPPIIILQGDHGPRSATDVRNPQNINWRERFSILNAIYLPGKTSVLYEDITPVNTFRLIFNEYFATNYQRLPDKNIY